MNDAGGVGLGQPLGGLCEVAEHRLEGRLLRVDQVVEGLAADQFHRDVVQILSTGLLVSRGADLVVTDLVDGDDVRVTQGRGGSRFHDEPSDPLFADDQLGGEDLQRDVALELRVVGAVDLPHATRAQWSYDPVVSDDVFGLEGAAHLTASRRSEQSARFYIRQHAPG